MGSEDTMNPALEETLDNFTDAQLNNELARRRKARLDEERQERLELTALWERNLDALLPLTLHKDGCKGTGTHHPGADDDPPCARCFLLHSKEMTWWDPEYRLKIGVEHAPIPEE